MAVAVVIAVATLATTAGAFSGNAGLLIGGKIMNSKDWEDVDIHNSMGLYADFKLDSWPVSLSLDLVDTGSKYDEGGLEKLSHTTEVSLGVRKYFELKSTRLKPYINGGFSFMSAELEYKTNANRHVEDDKTYGLWAGFGFQYPIYSSFTVGMDLRYSDGKVELFDKERHAGGFQPYVALGYKF